jgi:hypothetical protein
VEREQEDVAEAMEEHREIERLLTEMRARSDERACCILLSDLSPAHGLARSSSGPGRRPLKAEIAGSNPARATLSAPASPPETNIVSRAW